MLKNMKIKTSLLLGFGFTIVVSVIIVACTLLMMNSQRSTFTSVIDNEIEAVETIKDIRVDLNVAARDLRSILILTDNSRNAELQTSVQQYLSSLEKDLGELKAIYPLKDNRENALYDAAETWIATTKNILSSAMAGRTEEAIRQLQNEGVNQLNAMTSIAIEMEEALVQAQDSAISDQLQSITVATISILVVLLIALVIILIIATKIIAGITTPTAQVEKALVGFSEGHLDIPVTYQSNNELGAMCDALRKSQNILGGVIEDVCDLLSKMAGGNFAVMSRDHGLYVGDLAAMLHALQSIKQKLSSTMVQIHQAAEEVSAGADQVSSGAQALSQGATEQASSVEELAATINDISEQIKQNADNAQQASVMADSVGSKIEQSNTQMQEMTAAMDEISEKSNEIGKIIKTIEDIAFQTNILALNAAVEAARAGAAGKGFAVVADEVRNLASKSADASKSTSALIESSVKAVENGTRIATETAKDLVDVVEGTREIVTTINRIAEASKLQSDAVAQVTQGVDQISSVVQTNSATSEESAAASEELASQSSILKELVDQFTISDEFGSSGPSSLGFGTSAGSFGKSFQSNDDVFVPGSSDKY